MIWKTHNKKEKVCKCGIKTYEQNEVCVVCKVMQEVELKCQRLEAGDESSKG